jgi:hypothetical protein
MLHPSFATHYYLAENGPFKSLSDLAAGADDPVFLELLTRYQRDPSYRRRFGREYIQKRRAIEERVRQLFIAKGGKPRRSSPIYFTLGESRWFRELNAGHQEIRVNLLDLDPETTSITFPDSFVAMTREDKPYFNQVFLLNEIPEIVKRFGMPANDRLLPYDRYWETDFEVYIELQVWADLTA